MKIIIIAAMAANRVIGDSVNNCIPWHLDGEQQMFKKTTMGHPLIMGRKTYESIGHPLPGREMIIITRNKNYRADGCHIANNIKDALDMNKSSEKIFIIGGEDIYRQTIEDADEIILTVLQREVSGNIVFPEFSQEEFQVKRHEKFNLPEPYTITTYQRKIQT